MVGQEIPLILWNMEVYLRVYNKQPAPCLYPEPDQSSSRHSNRFP